MRAFRPIFLLCSLSAVVLLLVAGCGRRETAAEAGIRTGMLIVGNQAEPKDLDPHVVTAYTDMNVLYALFEGLTALDEKTSQGVPAAAEQWDVSPDGLRYTFHLRAGLVWSNGDPLGAGDFVWSFHRILAPKFGSEFAYMLWPIKNAEAFNKGTLADFAAVGVRAIDGRTLEISLERPTPYLPALAAHTTWMPLHRATVEKFVGAERPNTAWTRAGNLVGNGSFTLAEWTPNVRIAVAKNPRHWDAANTALNRIVFLPTESPAVEERDFRAGQTHITFGVPTSKIATYRADEPAKLRSDPFLQTYYLNFNTTKPPLADARVRRALALAIDRNGIARRALDGAVQPAHSFTPPDCAGYTAHAGQPDDFAAARALLAEAGFAGGAKFPELELQVKNDEIQPRVAEVLQATWQRELGVKVTIAQFEQKIWIQNQQSLAHQIAMITWIGDFVDPETFLSVPVGGGGNNWTGWANPEYDRLVATATKTADPAQRNELFQQAEALLLEQTPLAPLFHGSRTYLISPAVRGWEPALLGVHQYKKVRFAPR